MADKNDDRPMDHYDAWKESYEAGKVSPRETFEKTSRIALLLGYDLIDKLRYWEKESLDLSDDEIAGRVKPLVHLVDQLRTAYLDFADIDL